MIQRNVDHNPVPDARHTVAELSHSLLYKMVSTYLEANGFKYDGRFWFHPELGVRSFKDAIEWWMGREEMNGRAKSQ